MDGLNGALAQHTFIEQIVRTQRPSMFDYAGSNDLYSIPAMLKKKPGSLVLCSL